MINMKKVCFLFAMMFVALNFVGCSENDEVSSSAEGLLGTWKMVSSVYEGSSSITVQGQNIDSEYRGEFKNIEASMTITKNPNKLLAEGSYDIDVNYSSSGIPSSQTMSYNDVSNKAEWSLKDNVLTISGKSFSVNIPSNSGVVGGSATSSSQQFVIEELTASKLRIRSTVNETKKISGFTYKIKMDVLMEYIR